MKLKINLLLTLSIFVSCSQADPNKQIDEGKVSGTAYESKEIGWSIDIPRGWKVVSKDKIKSIDAKGKSAIEQSNDIIIDTKALKHLISFQKGKFNIFIATSEPFKEDFPGEYEQNNKTLKELLYNTYNDHGIKVDSLSGKDTIQGLEFYRFQTTVYAPNGETILHQILYSRLINGYSFGVIITYNNDEDKDAMINTFFKSKFITSGSGRNK